MSDNNQVSHPERIAPHSVEAEEAVLGSILINPDALFEVTSFLTGDDFFIVRHAWIWEAILAIHERGEAIDNITVVEELHRQSRLDSVGGPAYITYLINNTPSHINAETYGHIVERAAVRRRLLQAAQDIARTAIEENVELEDVVNRAELTLFGVTQRQLKKEMIPLRQAVNEYFDRIDYLYNHREESLGIASGFKNLDDLTGGLQKSDLIVVAARPGVGKTSFMLSVALNAARRSNARIAIFSLEMSRDQLVQRFYSADTGIGSHKFRLGNLDGDEWHRFAEATGKLEKLRIYIDDTPAITINQMRAKCRRLYREEGLDFIVVDYLQLINSGSKNENRVQEISYISRGLKELARELNVPLLTAAQLSRAVEQRSDKRPILSDLRESGSIEQDADIVMFLYREDLYDDASERPNQADVIISKHRNGPTGIITLGFNPGTTQFRDLNTTHVDLNRL